MDAAEVIEGLEARHAHDKGWLYVKEFMAIDFMALSFWGRYGDGGSDHPWLAYEVKVSRGDFRSELLKPDKRAWAEKICHAFYFATPKGLLKREEVKWEEPEDLTYAAFHREECPSMCRRERGRGTKTGKYDYESAPPYDWHECRRCKGKGFLRRSWVERNAPTLWLPRGVGLVEVLPGGTRLRKRAEMSEAEPLSRYHQTLLCNTAWNPGFLRTMQTKKRQIDWEAKQVRRLDEDNRREAQRAREVLAARLGHTVEVGSSWTSTGGGRGWERIEKCVVRAFEGDYVRVTTPELSYDPVVPLGEFLFEFVPTAERETMAA